MIDNIYEIVVLITASVVAFSICAFVIGILCGLHRMAVGRKK